MFLSHSLSLTIGT